MPHSSSILTIARKSLQSNCQIMDLIWTMEEENTNGTQLSRLLHFPRHGTGKVKVNKSIRRLDIIDIIMNE